MDVRNSVTLITLLFGAVSSGDPNSSDNERIDADLSREYANDHEDEGE